MSIFCCENICRSYQGQGVVEDITLRLEKGELVSLLGVSGVGKTTLLNILAGVDAPDSGRVMLQDSDITGKAGHVGYMLQKDLLLPFKTTLDNVSLPLCLKGMKRAEARKLAKEQLGLFGLSGSENKYPHQLSGGMRQRAALARTHFLGNKVILLDEPFSALDAMTKSEMHAWYLDIAAQTGLTTLFITHDVDEALALSDRVYIMSGVPGKITAEFTIPRYISSEKKAANPYEFILTEDFLREKRKLLNVIHGGQSEFLQ